MHKDYDQILSVKTKNKGSQTKMSTKYNPYEATPYSILHILFQNYTLKKSDMFVDFGCGKGRLLFFVHNLFGSSVTGIEMDEQLYEKTIKNKDKYLRKIKSPNAPIHVERCLAEEYKIKRSENKFYFFNPFSVHIFKKVINNILDSVEKNKRAVDLILYYPTDEYVEHLEQNTPFTSIQEIKIPSLYDINNNERFLIYRLKAVNER